MNFSLTSLIVDAADLESESSFWHRLLGGSITRTATHHFLQVEDLPVIVIQHAPGHAPPEWPDGAPQQMHFDLATDDVAAADKRVLDGGGRRTMSSPPPSRAPERTPPRPDIPSVSAQPDPKPSTNNRADPVSTNGTTGLVRRPSVLDGLRVADGVQALAGAAGPDAGQVANQEVDMPVIIVIQTSAEGHKDRRPPGPARPGQRP
ncbi:hypothetical protein M2283_001793 [Streptomyces pseudovenezuelae]|uniref:Glyoxalase-like domain-containing protein n=1 Tax=Streptomyces pseudovenezuelae TaxID=67350 RepID=A0ABT6LEZ7_9ACTN|nr:hypothetical protein [Streptomyces pseudovenezuelae]